MLVKVNLVEHGRIHLKISKDNADKSKQCSKKCILELGEGVHGCGKKPGRPIRKLLHLLNVIQTSTMVEIVGMECKK